MKIGLLGGGITALSFANFYKGEFEILEKQNECGGLCKSLKKNGFTFDYGGSHVIFSNDEEVLNFFKKLLKGNLVHRHRNSKILFNGHLVGYPFENDLASLGKKEADLCLMSFINEQLLKAQNKLKTPSNFKDWIIQTFGQRIANDYLIPYNEKIWKTPASSLNLDWIRNRVPQPPVEDVIASALGLHREGYSLNARFYYPLNGGIQSLIVAMENRVKNKIIKNFEIKKIKIKNKKFHVSDGSQIKTYDKIVSTLPLPVLLKCLPNVPMRVKNASRNLKYTSLVTVMLGVKSKKLNDISWMYIPSKKDGLFNRISFPSNYGAKVAPLGTSSVLAEITAKKWDDVWEKSDKELLDSTLRDLHRLRIIDKNKIVFKEVRRFDFAYVVSDLKYHKNVRIIKNFLHKQGIDLLGRFSEWEYINMDACARSAINKARELNKQNK